MRFLVVVEDARVDGVNEGCCCKLARIMTVPFVNAFAEVTARDVSWNERACGKHNLSFNVPLAFTCLYVFVDSSTVADWMRSTAEKTKDSACYIVTTFLGSRTVRDALVEHF